ncbi:arfaptin-1 isoform X1 [Clupea harengus]|uniref:Arfaptin-1 isoform X1 n=1 Tax=Clupea harengus TaxID=7950 RepID=A0A6P8EHD2_CLUHA|nr:arfaptin-1 isoform X1 [Clupea harengus]
MSEISVETEPSQAEGPGSQVEHEVGDQGQAEGPGSQVEHEMGSQVQAEGPVCQVQAEGPGSQVEHEVGDQGQAEGPGSQVQAEGPVSQVQAEGPGSQVEHEVGDQGQAEEAQRYPEDAQDTHEGDLRGTDSPGADQYDDVVYDVDLSDSGEDAQGDASLNHKREAHSDTDASLKDSEAAPTGNEASMDAKLKETMAEEPHRSSAAEIAVTSNGEADSSHDDVFQRDPGMSGFPSMAQAHVTSDSYGSTSEGIVEVGPYKGSASQPTTPTVDPSSVAASRLARVASDSQVELEKGAAGGQSTSGALVLADDLKNPAMEKLDLVRKWSINTYKCTKQILSEKLGRGSRTVDLELESQIDILRDNKRKYEQVIKLAQTLAGQLTMMMQTQRQLGDAFADLSLKSPELHEEFSYNADTQKLLSKNGETLLGAINFFISSVKTLVDKTIEDTLINIKQYEAARVEYDAYRTDLEELNLGPRDGNTLPKIEQSQQQFQIHREKYEQMRNDVSVKLKFLEENKVKVLHNQLILFHNAIAAYYAGNQQQLEQTLKQFHIKLKMPGGDSPSWLEEH